VSLYSYYQYYDDDLVIHSVAIGAHPSYIKVLWNNITNVLSRPVARMVDMPTGSKKRMITTRSIARDVGGKLLDEKWSAIDPENTGAKRDVMSLLGKYLI
jgi:ABC-type phosphate transport system ATPase subunit